MASPAVKQGRIAADNICGINSRYRHTINVSVIRLFDIDLASAGLTENQLIKRDIRYEKVYARVNSHELFYPQANDMTIKMLFDKKTGRIHGVQIAGRSGVDKRINVFATAMQAGLSVDRVAALELGYAPPFALAQDAVNRVCCIAEDVMNGLSDVVHWHDIKHTDNALLDVRTDEEHRAGAIPSSQHIPLACLRSRLGELPNERDIVVYSQYGQRGYMAERILKQHDFNAKNLSGGYGLFRIFTRNG
jgi:rhodanese-related sulfurtransferase